MAHFDLSSPDTPDTAKVRRVVRPFNNIGPACGGDEVTIDASELAHVAVAGALWTDAELRDAERKVEEARRSRMRSPTDDAARIVNDRMKQEAEDRKKRKAKERVEELGKAKEIAAALKAIAG